MRSSNDTRKPPEQVHDLWLASRSPRRLTLLRDAGIEVKVIRTGLDDALLKPGSVGLVHWTVALAYFKARAAGELLWSRALKSGHGAGISLVIGADTLVGLHDHVIGQPTDADDAGRIIRQLSAAEHTVTTGVAVLDLRSGRRDVFCDTAVVHVGSLTDEQIDTYVQSGNWQGKAGAYNLSERIEAGWPITYEGDPATIMGLPMRLLTRYLHDHWRIPVQCNAD